MTPILSQFSRTDIREDNMTYKKKVLLLVNAAAGTGNAGGNTYHIVECLAKDGCEVTVYPLLPDQKGLGAEEIISSHDGQFNLIVCCGGDGTLNHVINAIMKLTHKVPIGYFPSGSTNDFAKSLGVPRKLADNCAAISRGTAFSYDIGQFNQQYFNYIAAFGAFTAVSYQTSQNAKNSLGYPAYLLKSLSVFPESINYRCHMQIIHDGTADEDDFLFGYVSNSSSIAGISARDLKQIALNDGLFEVLLIKAPDRLTDIAEIINGLMSGDFNRQSPYVRLFKTSHVQFISDDRTDWTLDGEYGGKTSTADIYNLQNAMQIMIPASLRPSLPV